MIVGIVVLLVGASDVFGELQTASNEIWGVKPKFSGVAFMLLVSLVISTVLAALGHYLSGSLPGGAALGRFSFPCGDSLARRLGRRVLHPVLFTLGKLVLGLYLGESTVASSYGAASGGAR